MTLKRKYIRLALINSGVMALMSVALLGLLRFSIPELSLSFILGNGLLCFLFMVPVYYLSFIRHWNEGPVLSVRRLYTPLMICLVLLLPSLIYTSVAFGHYWKEYFIHEGTLNTTSIVNHLVFLVVPVFVLHVIQMLAISNEQEIIINRALLNIPSVKGNSETPVESAKQEEKSSVKADAVLTLHGNTKTDTSLSVNIGQLYYVESDANYLQVALLEDGQLEKKSIRMTLKQFEEATQDFPKLIRCHRAFVVNMNHVTYYEGSASKGELHFDLISDVVPVSRTYATAISESLR
jgi:hypothetical protein